MSGRGLTHLDAEGRARMVDVGGKAESARSAIARGWVTMNAATLERALAGDSDKGNVVRVAEIAGIMGGKHTSSLLPLCHPLALSSLAVRIVADANGLRLNVEAEARITGCTGVEMEALTAVSVACLTIYDMLKAIDRTMCIGGIALWHKDGGASGPWHREQPHHGPNPASC